MLNALNFDTQLQELDSEENDTIVEAERYDQMMRNLCSDEFRSTI